MSVCVHHTSRTLKKILLSFVLFCFSYRVRGTKVPNPHGQHVVRYILRLRLGYTTLDRLLDTRLETAERRIGVAPRRRIRDALDRAGKCQVTLSKVYTIPKIYQKLLHFLPVRGKKFY